MSDGGFGLEFPCSRVWVRDLAWFVGETARPIAVDSVAVATAVGFLMKLDPTSLGIMATLVGTLYGAKALERIQQTKADASKAVP